MKKVLISSVLLFMAVINLSAQKNTKVTTKTTSTTTKVATPVFKNLLDSFSYAAGYNVATNMKAQGISKVNVVIMQKAIEDVYKNTQPVITPDAGNACMQKQLAIFASEQGLAEKTKGVAFLETNKKRKEVITLADGLQYEVIKNGDVNGIKPKMIDTVVVNYIGTLIDGKEFDNSFKRGEPAAFPVTGVIKGWTEILQLMKPGDHWKVFIPSELAYGGSGAGGAIPPNAVLVFEITLEAVRPAMQPTEAPKNGQ